MCDDLLNDTMFRNLTHVSVAIAALVGDDNSERPHSAVDQHTPADHARTLSSARARPDAQDENPARQAIAQPMSTGTHTNRDPVGAGGSFSARLPALSPSQTKSNPWDRRHGGKCARHPPSGARRAIMRVSGIDIIQSSLMRALSIQ